MAVFYFFLAVASAASTNSAWYARSWQSDDGLPNNNVTALAQTPDGYLWLATPSQLTRFDGHQFDAFYQNSFASNYNRRITIIAEANDGSLWLPMDRGPIVHLKNGVVEIITNGVPDLVAESAIEDNAGALWVSYRGGTLCRIVDGKAYQFSERDGFPGAHGGCSLAVDSTGQFWFAQHAQIFRFRNDRFESVLQLPNFTTRAVAAREGGLWIASGNELFKYDEKHGLKEIGKFTLDAANTMPTTLVETRDGTVWIGTSSSGLFHYDGSTFENIPTSHLDILSLLEDREGNLWCGTAGGGLNRIQPRTIELQGTESGLPFETVESLCQDTYGTIWGVTQNGLLVNRTNHFWNTVSATTNWPGNSVACVAADRNGGVWIGGRSRVYYFHDGVFQILTGLNNRIVRALLPASNGDVWIGGERLEKFRDGTFTQIKLPPDVQIIRALAEDKAGNIWVGSANGSLLRVTNDKIFDETERTFGEHDSIRCLTAAADGSLWIGFATDGLGRLKDGKFSRIKSPQGLDDNGISQIVADNLGWFWFGADHGIFKVQQKELDALADGKIEHIQSIHYGRNDGLESLQADFGFTSGALRASDGHLWIPLRSALASIDPTRLPDNLDPPPILLNKIMVDNQLFAAYGGAMPVGNVLNLQNPQIAPSLPAGHHRLEFEFTALNFSAPENVQFRYRLAGVDDDWIDGKKQRSVSYPGLAVGHYYFQVTARKNGGAWNPVAASFAFFIAPFFWETWWFKCVALIFFTAGVILVGRYVSFRRLRGKLQALEQHAALERERARIAKDIHDDLGGSLTHTALLLNLASQDRNAPEKVGTHVEQAVAAIRQVTESIDEIVWAANPRNDTLADLMDYISLFAVQFLEAANIRCRIDLPKQFPNRALSPEIRHSLFLVVKESLNNVVRHAKANEVNLQIVMDNESLKINVIDDGRGFGSDSQNHYCSDGLKNMKQRMAEIGGEFFIESKPDAGTKISAIYFWPKQK